MPHKIAILGAGSWGTAVAIHLARGGHDVILWGHDAAKIKQIAIDRVNTQYLSEIAFPDLIFPTANLDEAVSNSDYVIIAVPSHAFKDLIDRLPTPNRSELAWLTKGLDPKDNHFLSEVVRKKFVAFKTAMISGPSFAREVASQLPTALVISSLDQDYLKNLHDIFHHQQVRVYDSNDLLGVQLCGAVKNVLAIACGISDGLKFGANAKAALITRGLAEMKRLGLALGAQEKTFAGLAGVGDLVLTCTDNQSRNRRFGLYLGEGKTIEEAERLVQQVVEGKYNVSQVNKLAQKFGVEMPISFEVLKIIEASVTPRQAVLNLMNRPPQSDHY